MKTTIRIFAFLLIIATLAACTPAPTTLPTPTASATPRPTATVTLTPTVTPTPTPTLTPTPAYPAINSEIQTYLDTFSSYRITEIKGVPSIFVTHGDQEYLVMQETKGEWVRNYNDMSKFVHPDGSFDMAAAEVFSFGVDHSLNPDGQPVVQINLADYAAYQAAMAQIYNTLAGKTQLVVPEITYARSGIGSTLTGETELLIHLPPEGQLRLIGSAASGEFRLITLATSYGPFTFSLVRGKIIDYGVNDNIGDTIEEFNFLAQGTTRREVEYGVDYLGIKILLTSDQLNPRPSFTIADPTAEANLRALSRGLDYSLDQLAAEVDIPYHWLGCQLELFQTLSGLPQPLPVYQAF